MAALTHYQHRTIQRQAQTVSRPFPKSPFFQGHVKSLFEPLSQCTCGFERVVDEVRACPEPELAGGFVHPGVQVRSKAYRSLLQ